MADVIGVMEVLHLKCGVSVSKRQHSECDWEPDRVSKYHIALFLSNKGQQL